MAMNKLNKAASGGLGRFILFGFLVLAVAGLVLADAGGFFRGGMASNDVATIGGDAVSIVQFDRHVRRSLSRIGIDTAQAYQSGFIDQLLNGELRSLALQKAARQYGILLDDERVATEIAALIDPMATDGRSRKDVFNQILVAQGMSEAEFINLFKRDMTANLMAQTVQSAFTVIPATLVHDMFMHEREMRDVEVIVFPHSDVDGVTEPSDDALQAFYERQKHAYATPELRQYDVLIVDTDRLADTIVIDDSAIAEYYESNIDAFSRPEQWTVAQAVLPDEDKAQSVLAAYEQEGGSLEDAVVQTTGNASTYFGEKALSSEDMLEDIRPAVTAEKDAGAMIGPLRSPLGWHVFILKEHSPARIQPLTEVRGMIAKDLRDEQLADQRYEMAAMVDDLLASGAPLEDITAQVPVTMTALDPVDSQGLDKQGGDGFRDFEELRGTLLELGAALTQAGDTSPVIETQDGRMVAIHLKQVTPLAYPEMAEIREELSREWIKTRQREKNRERLETYLDQDNTGPDIISAIAAAEKKAVKRLSGVQRGEATGPLTPQAVAALFRVKPVEPVLLELEDALAVAVVTDIRYPDSAAFSQDDRETMRKKLSSGLQEDALLSFLNARTGEMGVHINRPLLERIYGPESQNF